MKKLIMMMGTIVTLTGCFRNVQDEPKIIDLRSGMKTSKEVNDYIIGPKKLSLQEVIQAELRLDLIKEEMVRNIGIEAYEESGDSYQRVRALENIRLIKRERYVGN
ncbi:MAG: hypothetical protein ACRCZ9_12405 [Fusobacteriaceae bacterium]